MVLLERWSIGFIPRGLQLRQQFWLSQIRVNRCAEYSWNSFTLHLMQYRDPKMEPGVPNELPSRLVDRLDILECTRCRGALVHLEGALVCQKCDAAFLVQGGKIYFDTPPAHE